MIKFKKLSIRNFLSYGEVMSTINLDTSGTTLIIGENLDNTSSGGSNGVGKTTWINALVYVLYGKPLTSISLDHLVNNINKKNMFVEVVFEKNNKLITVRRARKEKKLGNYVKVFIHDIGEELNEEIHDVTNDNINRINEFISELLGLEYDLFIRIVTFSATHLPFLDLPLRQQSEMMEELFNLSQLSEKASELKERIKTTKQDIEITDKLNEQRKKEHERHESQLKTAEFRVNEWETDHKNKIINLESELDQFKTINIPEQEKILNEINSSNEELTSLNNKKIGIESDLKTTSSSMELLVNTIHSTKESINTINSFIENSNNELLEIKKKADNLPKEYDLNDDKSKLDTCKQIDEEINNFIKKGDSIKGDLSKLESETKKLESEIEHLKDSKCPYCHQNYDDAKRVMDENKKRLEVISNDMEELKSESTKLLELISMKQLERDGIMNTVSYSYDEINKLIKLRYEYAEKMESIINNQNTRENKHKIPGLLKKISECEEAIVTLKTDFDSYTVELEKIINNINELNNEISQLKTIANFNSMSDLLSTKNKISLLESKLSETGNEKNPYTDQYNELKNTILDRIDLNRMNELSKLLEHQTYLVKLLTKKDSFIRKNLLKRNLLYLNSRLREYLSMLDLPHVVTFTEEMSANISQFGRELSFGNLSSGQKARVNIALALSFRDVLQKSHESINICVLDEVLDVGLDGSGVQNAARALKEKALSEDMSMFIISHRDEVGNIFDRKLTVQMKNSFSILKQN